MKAYQYITIAAAALLLVGCQQESELSHYDTDPNAVRIHATIGNMQEGPWRKPASDPIGSTENDRTKFNGGDQISVKTDDQEAITYTRIVGIWIPETGKYLKWNKQTHEFKAWYPANKYTGYEPVPSQQDTPEAIADADFMSYKGTHDKSEGSVEFEMERQTARLVISQIRWEEEYDLTTHIVEDIRINCIGTRGIEPYKAGSGNYYALLNPGAAVDDTFITLTVANTEDNTTTTETVRGIPALEAGRSYECTLTIGKTTATISNITVMDWTNGGIIGDEENMSEEVNTSYVDLGLSTGTLWATHNVGANAPEEVGDYFAWAETAPKATYNFQNEGDYKYGVYDYSAEDYGTTKYNSKDGKITLDATDDAATTILGNEWRTPTVDDLNELLTECTWTATSRNDVSGYEVKGQNGNSIFIPVSGYKRIDALNASSGGYYWTSSLVQSEVRSASILQLDIMSEANVSGSMRYFGLPIRPVYVP